MFRDDDIFTTQPTYTFEELFESSDKFLEEFKASGFNTEISDDKVKVLYLHLYAEYGHSHINDFSKDHWKYNIWSTIDKYGPTWEKNLQIQKRLRELTEKDLLGGGQMVTNVSMNPSTEPTTQTTEELPTVNQQTTSKNMRSILSGYEHLVVLLEADVTTEFTSKFKKFFKKIIIGKMKSYITNEEDD